MIVRFTKGDGKPDTLTCIRDDGTRTWSAVGASVGVVHDLTHYAVETTLGFAEAFFGLLAAGRDIESFGTKDGRKDTYPAEALLAESVVGLIQLSVSDANPLTARQISEQLTTIWANNGLGEHDVDEADIDTARNRLLDLLVDWRALAPGASMEVPFPLD